MTTLTLIGKPGCHLCDDARAVIDAVLAERPHVRVDERSILDDHVELGENLWSRFSSGRDQQLWWYRAVSEACSGCCSSTSSSTRISPLPTRSSRCGTRISWPPAVPLLAYFTGSSPGGVLYCEIVTTPPDTGCSVVVDSFALEDPEHAVIVHSDDTGERVVSTGPFAEVREFVGGTYVIEVADIDEAIAWARKSPASAAGGHIEIRPLAPY